MINNRAMIQDIQSLHRLYCQLTGFNLRLAMWRERAWYEYVKAGYTGEDLKLVIGHLQRGIHSQKRQQGCLRFSNLIEQLDRWEEELCMARAHLRNNRPATNRELVIEVFRPTVRKSLTVERCKPAKEVIQRLVEELKKAVQ